MVPVGDLYFLVDQLAAVGVAVDGQLEVLAWLYVDRICLAHPLQIFLKGPISCALFDHPHRQLPEQERFDEVVANEVMVSFRYLPVEGLHLIINDLIVEDERCVSLDFHLEVKGIAGDHLGIVLHHLADIVILILAFLKVSECLIYVLFVDVGEPEPDLVGEVLRGLDVDEQAADHPVYLKRVDGVELVYEDLRDGDGVEAVDAEAQLLDVEVYAFGGVLDLGENVEDQSADAFQETAVLRSQDVQEQLVHLLELVRLVLVVLRRLVGLRLRDKPV